MATGWSSPRPDPGVLTAFSAIKMRCTSNAAPAYVVEELAQCRLALAELGAEDMQAAAFGWAELRRLLRLVPRRRPYPGEPLHSSCPRAAPQGRPIPDARSDAGRAGAGLESGWPGSEIGRRTAYAQQMAPLPDDRIRHHPADPPQDVPLPTVSAFRWRRPAPPCLGQSTQCGAALATPPPRELVPRVIHIDG